MKFKKCSKKLIVSLIIFTFSVIQLVVPSSTLAALNLENNSEESFIAYQIDDDRLYEMALHSVNQQVLANGQGYTADGQPTFIRESNSFTLHKVLQLRGQIIPGHPGLLNI
ncbi:MAG: hypothetical protein GXY50_11245 [Syntrophomonadaceae bacterium]|nr:hypothetical protein [Syntrophomonadaceae bacterium]